MRTASTIDKLLQNGKRNKNFLKHLCGLPVSTYFSGLKIKWLIDNVSEVKEAIKEDRCLFGTVDSWLIWVKFTYYYYYHHIFLASPLCFVSLSNILICAV